LLEKKPDLTNETHELSPKVRGLVEEVHAATCKAAPA
jgi:hypothetical protein